MPGRYSRFLKYVHLIGDLLVVNLSFLGAFFIKFDSFTLLGNTPNLLLWSFYNVSWLILVALLKPYKIGRSTRALDIIKNHATIITLHLLLLTAFFVVNLNQVYSYSRLHIMLTFGFSFAGILFWKFVLIFWIKIIRTKGYNHRKIVIVGYGDLAEDLKNFFNFHPEFGFNVLGFFDNKPKANKVIGNLKQLEEFALSNKVDQIYCCLPYLKYDQVKSIIDFADNNLLKVKLIADFRGFSYKGLELERYDHIPVINVTAVPLDVTKNKVLKRTFDITFSLTIILMIMSWLLPLLALAIRINSRGPIFFLQRRTGKNNQDFWCYKLRTMYVNGEANSKQAEKNDPRVTAIGAFLRKLSLDELPQFFNVLLGDMSVVGPRPHMISHTQQYAPLIDKFMHRHIIKPGITGLAQAKGYRGETRNLILMKNRVKLDRFYINNWSLIFDLKIIYLTVSSLLKSNENAF